ncbi:MAG: hypothetical protein ACFFCD_12010 [Promethearchaeota archaeon]
MTQQLKVKIPGTSYSVDLTLNPATNTGKVVLERNAVEAQKALSDLSLGSIQGVLLDLLETKGLYPNPRIISRVLEDLTEPMEPETETPTSAALGELPEMPSASEITQEVPPQEIPPQVAPMTVNPLLKVKDIIAAANSHMSKLDNLIETSGLPVEIESTMQAIQDLLVQAKNVINDVLSS